MEQEKLLYIVQETSQIIQDITELFQRMQKSIAIVQEMKNIIAKWTAVFNYTNLLMINYTISLKERTETVPKQLMDANKFVKD